MASGRPSSLRQTWPMTGAVSGSEAAAGRAISEEDHRLGAADGVELVVRRGDGQRAGAVHALAGDAQRLAARRQHAKLRTRAQEILGEPGAGVGQVLAVVEHEQQLRVAQALEDVVEQVAVRAFANAEHMRDGLEDELRVEHGREIDQPGAVAEPVGVRGGDLDGQPRLARAARPGQRDETRFAQQRRELVELALRARRSW